MEHQIFQTRNTRTFLGLSWGNGWMHMAQLKCSSIPGGSGEEEFRDTRCRVRNGLSQYLTLILSLSPRSSPRSGAWAPCSVTAFGQPSSKREPLPPPVSSKHPPLCKSHSLSRAVWWWVAPFFKCRHCAGCLNGSAIPFTAKMLTELQGDFVAS